MLFRDILVFAVLHTLYRISLAWMYNLLNLHGLTKCTYLDSTLAALCIWPWKKCSFTKIFGENYFSEFMIQCIYFSCLQDWQPFFFLLRIVALDFQSAFLSKPDNYCYQMQWDIYITWRKKHKKVNSALRIMASFKQLKIYSCFIIAMCSSRGECEKELLNKQADSICFSHSPLE